MKLLTLKPLDLRARVTGASVLALVCGLAVLSLAINLLLANRLDADASRVLEERSDAQLATVQIIDKHAQIAKSTSDEVLDQESWVFVGARELAHPTTGLRLDSEARRLGAGRGAAERDVGNVRLRAEPVLDPVSQTRVAMVVVGISLEPYEHSEKLALAATLILDLFVLGAGGLLARRAVGAALRPVAEMTERAADWSERDLHRRFNMGPAQDEISGLAATLDELLGRIDAVIRHEQRFSAEVAHELRTPLSGIRAEVELALRPGRSPLEIREALEHVLAGAQRVSTVIDTLLAAARNDSRTTSGWSDPRPAIDEVLASMRPAAAAHGVRLSQQQSPVELRVGVHPDLLARALHPLLDNAIRHARAEVVVSTRVDDGRVVVRVRDDGPGIAADQAELIFEPGVSTTGSAGLGLPLARRLASSADGDVSAISGVTGGRFELRLPGGARASRAAELVQA